MLHYNQVEFFSCRIVECLEALVHLKEMRPFPYRFVFSEDEVLLKYRIFRLSDVYKTATKNLYGFLRSKRNKSSLCSSRARI